MVGRELPARRPELPKEQQPMRKRSADFEVLLPSWSCAVFSHRVHGYGSRPRARPRMPRKRKGCADHLIVEVVVVGGRGRWSWSVVVVVVGGRGRWSWSVVVVGGRWSVVVVPGCRRGSRPCARPPRAESGAVLAQMHGVRGKRIGRHFRRNCLNGGSRV